MGDKGFKKSVGYNMYLLMRKEKGNPKTHNYN